MYDKESRMFGLLKDPISLREYRVLEKRIKFMGDDLKGLDLEISNEMKKNEHITKITLSDGYTLTLRGIFSDNRGKFFSKDLYVEDSNRKKTKIKNIDGIMPVLFKKLKSKKSALRVANRYLKI